MNHDDPHVEDLMSDLQDGLALMNFIQNQTGSSPKCNKSPRTPFQCRDNVSAVFNYLNDELHLNLTTTPQDIYDKNLKRMLSLFKSLYTYFALCSLYRF